MLRTTHPTASWITRLLQRSSGRSGAKRPLRRRRLRLESLEGRALLSVDILPSVTGTVYQDLTGNGLTADDTRLAGVTVKLYRDNGNGSFDAGGDTLVSSDTSDAAGRYTFEDLQAGTYFIQQLTPPKLVAKTGQSVQKLVVAASDTHGVIGTTIDSFDTTSQSVNATLQNGKKGSSSEAAPEALGGRRDLFAQLSSNYGMLSTGVNSMVPGALDFASSSVATGQFRVIWDGTNNDPGTVSAAGLGGRDLTDGGASNAIQFMMGADHPSASLLLKVYKDANNWSQATVSIPNTGDGDQVQEANIPFANFVTMAGSGADFSEVGAVALEMNGVPAVDVQMGSITTVGPKVFTTDFANEAQIDLAITKSASPATAVAGTQLTYKLTMVNNGPSDATGVKVVDTLPSGVTFVSATSSQGTASGAGGVVSLNVGAMPSGATVTATVVVAVGTGARGTLTNTAEVSGDQIETTMANNRASVETPVSATIDLAIKKSAVPAEVKPGGKLVYSLVIINNGPSDATGVKLVDALPSSVSYVSATSTQGSVSASGSTLTGSLGSLGVGQSITVTVTVNVKSTAKGTITNTGVVSGNETETTLANNEDSVTTKVAVVVKKKDIPLSKRRFLGR